MNMTGGAMSQDDPDFICYPVPLPLPGDWYVLNQEPPPFEPLRIGRIERPRPCRIDGKSYDPGWAECEEHPNVPAEIVAAAKRRLAAREASEP
jgi:hypothetical protein